MQPLAGGLDATYVEPIKSALSIWMPRALALLCGLVYLWRIRRGVRTSAPGLDRDAGLLLAGLVLLAWSNRFMQDDAFISFRYAANLVHGFGPVWNPGQERVEGYTNPLWMLLMTIPIALGRDPVLFAYLAGLLCFGCTLAQVHQLARRVLPWPPAGPLAMLLLGANFSFSAYATGGLETQLQAALLVTVANGIAALGAGRWSRLRLLGISVAAAAAVLTRPDSLLPVGVLAAWLVGTVPLHRDGAAPRRSPGDWLTLFLPAAAILGAFAAWKLSFYGELLPNTYYAKAAHLVSPFDGARYVIFFCTEYGVTVALFLLLAEARRFLVPKSLLFPLAAIVALWFVYVVRIGGDFMEFRAVIPIVPFLSVLMVAALSPLFELRRAYGLAVVAFLLVSSAIHGAAFQGRGPIEPIHGLHGHLTLGRWCASGQALGRVFGGRDPAVTIATTAAGAIPFYSGLPTVDMYGLSDREVARSGHAVGRRPGHQRVATLAYLKEKGVNLVVGHPKIVLRSEPDIPYTMENAVFTMAEREEVPLPESSRVIELPLDEQHALHLLYLMPSPAVDRVIEQLHLRTFPIDRTNHGM